jgi:hypothetical protein
VGQLETRNWVIKTTYCLVARGYSLLATWLLTKM